MTWVLDCGYEFNLYMSLVNSEIVISIIAKGNDDKPEEMRNNIGNTDERTVEIECRNAMI